jgi:hypothetical protein
MAVETLIIIFIFRSYLLLLSTEKHQKIGSKLPDFCLYTMTKILEIANRRRSNQKTWELFTQFLLYRSSMTLMHMLCTVLGLPPTNNHPTKNTQLASKKKGTNLCF